MHFHDFNCHNLRSPLEAEEFKGNFLDIATGNVGNLIALQLKRLGIENKSSRAVLQCFKYVLVIIVSTYL